MKRKTRFPKIFLLQESLSSCTAAPVSRTPRRVVRTLGLLFSWCLTLFSPFHAAAQEPVAIVTSLKGPVQIPHRGEDQEKASLELFQALEPSSVLELAPEATVILAFVDGSRYEIRGPAKVTMAQSGPRRTFGRVMELTKVSPIPELPAIAVAQNTGSHGGAISLSRKFNANKNRCPASYVIASAPRLLFSPIEGAKGYLVIIEVNDETPAYRGETKTTELVVPKGKLDPGTHYKWRVEAIFESGEKRAVRGPYRFWTLPANRVEARTKLLKSVEGIGDASSWSLLAAIDRQLNLRFDAIHDLRTALKLDPDNRQFKKALKLLEQQSLR